MKIGPIIITTQAKIDADNLKRRTKYLRIGKEIGIIEVLRFNQQSLSAAKFKESARFFNFDDLNNRYPYEEIFKTPPRSNQRPTEKNVTPQSNGTTSQANT